MPTIPDHDDHSARRGRGLLDRFAHYQPSTALRQDAFERIVAARASGERRVLPSAPPSAGVAGTRRWLVFAAAAAIVTAIMLVIRMSAPPGLTAADLTGTLTFAPAQPAAGARIAVHYAPPAMLGRQPTLRLRARFRTRWSAEYNHGATEHVVAVLHRQGDGSFTGSFDLPPDAVYAALAVEDTVAAHVDARDDRPWELLVYRDGKPTLDALTQQFNDVLGRSPDSALAVVRRATELYPDDPTAWASRVAFESYMLGGTYLQSTMDEQMRRFRTFDSTLRRRADVSPDAMMGLRMYAAQIGTPEHSLKDASAYWMNRLAHDSAAGILADLSRLDMLGRAVRADSTRAPAALDTLERLWRRGDSITPQIADDGFYIALAAHDSAAVFRWLNRDAPSLHDVLWYRYQTLANREPRYRDAVLQGLRSLIAGYQQSNDAYRDLGSTAEADARQRAEYVRGSLVTLGELLLQRGDTAAALDTLRRTIDDGWDTQRFEHVAAIYLRTRDTANAARVYALVAADPATPAAHADSLTAMFNKAIGPDRWNRLVSDASSEMRRRIMEGATSRALPNNISITNGQGSTVPLSSLTNGRVSVLAFWSRFCGASRAQMPLLPAMSGTLQARGIAFVPLTTEADSPEVGAFLRDAKVALTSYFDDRGEARRATDNNATPTYYVLDASGRVRFEGHTPALAITEAVALQQR